MGKIKNKLDSKGTKDKIIELFFIKHLRPVDISKKLNVGMPYITKIIQKDSRYIGEKESRIVESKEKNKIQKRIYAQNKREKERQEKQQVEMAKEKIAGLEIDYYNAYGVDLSDKTMEEIAELSVSTGINPEKFTVFYNKGNTTEEEKEIVLYRLDKVTEEEKQELDGNKKINALKGDVNFDGLLTQEDADLLSILLGRGEFDSEIQETIADIDNDGRPNNMDTTMYRYILWGKSKL